jgi:hypothetical protein
MKLISGVAMMVATAAHIQYSAFALVDSETMLFDSVVKEDWTEYGRKPTDVVLKALGMSFVIHSTFKRKLPGAAITHWISYSPVFVVTAEPI